jgi:hypothetical protein
MASGCGFAGGMVAGSVTPAAGGLALGTVLTVRNSSAQAGPAQITTAAAATQPIPANLTTVPPLQHYRTFSKIGDADSFRMLLSFRPFQPVVKEKSDQPAFFTQTTQTRLSAYNCDELARVGSVSSPRQHGLSLNFSTV